MCRARPLAFFQSSFRPERSVGLLSASSATFILRTAFCGVCGQGVSLKFVPGG